jgi:Na+-driven multidrug efflux pump
VVAELGAQEMMWICMIMIFMSMATALHGCIGGLGNTK